jgi:maleylacetoacetate isomerase
LIPALAHDGHLITQSMAIIEYLDEIVPEPPLFPKTAYERARVREISYVVGCDIHPVNNLRIGLYTKETFGATDDDIARWHRHWIRFGFDALEIMLSGSPHTGAYCHGDTPTMADILLIPQCANARRVKMELDPWPTIARIEERALRHPAFDAALPKNQPDAE